jgi:hypothetical protein
MFSQLRPEDFGKLDDPEYRKQRGLAVEGEVVKPSPAVSPATPAPQDDKTLKAFADLAGVVKQLADRMDALESAPVYQLPATEVVRALRSGVVQVNGLSFDDD